YAAGSTGMHAQTDSFARLCRCSCCCCWFSFEFHCVPADCTDRACDAAPSCAGNLNDLWLRSCAAGSVSVDGACAACPVGHFKRLLTGVCEPCAPGSYSDAPGATECTVCTAGSFGTTSGADSSSACSACSVV